MRDSEQSILNIFKSNPSKEYSTTALAKEFFPKEYPAIAQDLLSADKATKTDAKRRKFQLHRKLLYYLNKLVEQKILKITRIEEKGEKAFALAIDEGDIVLEKGYKKIIITKPALPAFHIDHYESSRIMKKYEEDTFVTKLNSVLIESSKIQGISHLYSMVRECFNNVNDVIAINDFGIFIRPENSEEISMLLDKLVIDTDDFSKAVSLIVNMPVADASAFKDFVSSFCRKNPRHINIIFSLTHKDLQRSSHMFESIVDEFSKNSIKLNIKNNDLVHAPYFKGRAGMYTFDEEEWSEYRKYIYDSVFGIACSQSAIAININRFFENYRSDSEFRQAVLDAAKVLLSANELQRRKSNEYFRNIHMLSSPGGQNNFYKFSRNYIRFWNYDWHTSMEENTNLLELLRSTKDVVENFCVSEETIFKSCGIPIKFKIAFSSAFRNFDPVFMGDREYKKANVCGIEDFYKGEIKRFIMIREHLFEIFDGGDRLRIFRTKEFKAREIIHELSTMLSTFKIPFFTYDFSTVKGTVKLTNFI